MGFYQNSVYPRLVSIVGKPKPIQIIGQRIIPLAEGVVLEIGVGSGVNFAFYDPAKASRLYALEPNPGIIRLAERWQQRWKPILQRVFKGCHLTPDIPSLITQGGFQIEEMETSYLAAFPKSLTH